MRRATTIACILLISVLAIGAAGVSAVHAQGGAPPVQSRTIWLGPPAKRPSTVAELIDTSPVLVEAHRRMAVLMEQRGFAAARRITSVADTYAVGDRKKFWAIDFSQGVGFPYHQYEVEAECRVVGEYAYYFIELEELTTVQDEHIQELVTAFEESTPGSPRDSAKGIYEHDTEVFGDAPDVDGDPRIVILLTDIPQAAGSGSTFYSGYFYGVNQSLDDPFDFGGGVKQRSNKTEMLYVSTRYAAYEDPDPDVEKFFRDLVKSTVAHEFQHLIQYGNDPLEITAVNEGLSEYASYICGYGLPYIVGYVSRPNVDMFSWQKYGDSLDDYSRVALWTYYLGYRFGDDFIRSLSTNPQAGLAGLEAALAQLSAGTFGEVFNDFATALYLEGRSELDDRFSTGSLVTWIEPQVYGNLHPSSQRITLEPYGAVVLRCWNCSDLTLSLPDGLPSEVTARVALKGGGPVQVSTLTASGAVVTGVGTTHREAGVVLSNRSNSRTATFRVTTTATQSDTGMVKYENGEPYWRIYLTQTWYPALRITPEVTPAKITGIWVYLLGSAPASIAVRTMTANPSVPGTWIVNETPVFSTTVDPQVNPEGWLYVPVPDVGTYTPEGVDYLVAMRIATNAIGYSDLTRGADRSFLREGPTAAWRPLSHYAPAGSSQPLAGDWMFRAEFTYQDTVAPSISLAMIQHPLFPAQADVYVMGSEPLHPGASSGTLTPSGGSPVNLIFEQTLGMMSIVDPTPVLLETGQTALSVEAFDRYGGHSDTATQPMGISRIGAGEPASLVVTDETGAVTIDIPAGDHRGTTLVITPYDKAPSGLVDGPQEATSSLGAPVVSLGPTGWVGPSRGSELRIPVHGFTAPGDQFHFERWSGETWVPLPGGVSVSGGYATGQIPGGGWYRLDRGEAPEAPGSFSGIELLGNAPNPFNPQTTISFRIPPVAAGKRIKLTVLNVRGQLVKTLLDDVASTGLHRVTWSGDDASGRPVASGIYLYRLEAGGTVLTRKMLLLR